VKLDEPVGKSDGTVKGRRVFECEPKFGAWVRGTNVTVGDFPERDLMDENSDEEAERENQDEEDEL
jgi:tubulin-folding cofactor B